MRLLKSVAKWMPLPRRAKLVTRLLPARHWYRAALWASKMQARVTSLLGGNRALTEALMLDNWLRELTFSGAFPIPWRAVETKALDHVGEKMGVLFCWTHLPLVEMPLRALMGLGYAPPLMVAHPGKIAGENEFVVPGLAERAPATPVGPHVLTRIRTVLREGGTVACLVDAQMGATLSPRVLRIAGRAGARVIFQWAERQNDGSIQVSFIDAPSPFCRDAAEIEENMKFLRAANRLALEKLGVQLSESAMKGSARERDKRDNGSVRKSGA